MYTDLLILLFGRRCWGKRVEGSPAQDDSELNALRERMKTLSSEKAALHEKIKKLFKAKKG